MSYLNTTLKSEDQSFRSGIIWSLLAHVILISFFAIKAFFFTAESIDFTQAVRVDIVGLPDKLNDIVPPAPAVEESKQTSAEETAKDIPKDAPKEKPQEVKVKEVKVKESEAPKTATKDADAVNLNKLKSKQQMAVEKLKALSAIDKIKKETAAEKAAVKIRGNEISPGTALRGLSKLQHEAYAADLDRHIKQNWALPEWLTKRDLKAQAKVFIDSKGNIINRKIIRSSGNPSYDDEVLATIDRSSPFPTPPDKFVKLVSAEGILIGFPE